MVVALVLVSVALAITLALLMFGNRAQVASPTVQQQIDAQAKARQAAEAELEKKRKDLEEQRAQVVDLKEQLKQAKKKNFDHKESGKGDRDLVKAREEVERNASIQLEVVRNELGAALEELDRLKSNSGRPSARREAAPSERPAAPQVTVQKVIRELNDGDREKMTRLETEATKERVRAAEMEKELKRVKGRSDTQNRIYLVAKSELELVKDKYKAIEKRLNRTLIESDLIRRAIKDLEKKTGVAAGRTELTQDEVAASDHKVEEQAKADAAQSHDHTPPAAAAEPVATSAAQPPAPEVPAPAEPALTNPQPH
jgi:chromosome segregation ATPase